MDWEAIRKLRKSRIYDEQSFKLHKPIPHMTAHRAGKVLKNVNATADAVAHAIADETSPLTTSGPSRDGQIRTS